MDRIKNTDTSATPPVAPSAGTTGYPKGETTPGANDGGAFDPWYLHMLIEEQRNVITSATAGPLTPDFTSTTQLNQAIEAKISAATPAASTTVVGVSRHSTNAESQAGTSTTVSVTPASLSATVSDYQTFTTSGTWTKPAWATGDQLVIVELWGGGGGGGSAASGGGGGGGAYNRMITKASDLGATETVTIGDGGAIDAAGGDSSFGSHISAYGGGHGGGGSSDGGGGGGGTRAAGASNSSSASPGMNGGAGYAGSGGAGGGLGSAGADGAFDAGGGGGAYDNNAGGGSAWGGGGGAGGTATGGSSQYGGGGGGSTGGPSLFGGDGGGANTAGTAPGGGGGNGSTGGAGARGECRVRVLRN